MGKWTKRGDIHRVAFELVTVIVQPALDGSDRFRVHIGIGDRTVHVDNFYECDLIEHALAYGIEFAGNLMRVDLDHMESQRSEFMRREPRRVVNTPNPNDR